MHDFRRGSEWRKWDLHAHTPLDNAWENKPNLYSDEDKRKFAKEYITFAKQQGLSAIAITDHNFCNNIEDCLIKYIQQEAVSNDIVVFPGFEITAKDGSGIHILCIFPEDTNLNKIHEIVKRCFKMGTQLQGEFVPVSDKTITELKKEIDDAKLDSVLIFAHAESDNGIFNKKVIQGQRRIEEWHNPAVEMTQLSCPIENLSSKYKCFCDNNDSNYRRKMAYIMASDCRRIQKNGLSDRFALGDKYSWIKADLTFDGLKQAILEPEKRIYNGDIPEKIKHINNEKTKYIDRIHLSTEANNGKWFAQDLLLNYELVSIIGNKGSGKSALADILGLLGNCRKSSDFSFLSKDKFYKDPLANQHKAEIYWRNNDTNAENTICLFSSTQENQIEKVKYIPQNYFERICNSVDNQKDLKQEIENVIFQHLSIDEKQNAINFSNLIEIANKKNNIKREELENKLNLSIKKYVSTSNLLLSKNLLLNKSYLEEKEKQRDNIEKQIKELENKKVEKINNNHINNKIQDINIQIQNIRSKIKDEKCSHTKDSSDLKKLEEIIEEIEKFKNNYDSVRNSISSKIDDLNIDIKDIFSFTINFDILETKKLEISSKLASQCKIINEREEECKKLENEKISLENLLTGESKKYNDYINDLNTLKSNLASIMGDKDTIGTYYYYEHLCSQEYIQSIENEKKISFEEMQNISKEIFATYLDEKEIYSKLKTNVDKYIREFGNEHSSNINIDFNSKITINYQEFRDNIELYICKKGIFYGECRDDFFAKYKDLEFLNKDEFINQCLSLINDIKSNDNNKEDSIKFSLKNEEKEEDFYKYIFSGKYISVNYELRFNNKLISMLSPGERGLLLLIFFLLADKSNVPLILDQPEENLDNETIYSILVPLILQAKKYRQVIMVTHNPNLAVVCDSEQIICAEFNINGNPKIKYTTGSIENKNINEKIVNILEGTMPAFQNREDKYRKNKKY